MDNVVPQAIGIPARTILLGPKWPGLTSIISFSHFVHYTRDKYSVNPRLGLPFPSFCDKSQKKRSTGAFKKINIAFMHALKIGIIIEVTVGIAVFFLAPYITALFTRAEGASRIAGDLIAFLRIMCFFYPATAFAMFSSSIFQGVGKGINALIVTIIRTVLLTLIFAVLFTSTLKMGLL